MGVREFGNGIGHHGGGLSSRTACPPPPEHNRSGPARAPSWRLLKMKVKRDSYASWAARGSPGTASEHLDLPCCSGRRRHRRKPCGAAIPAASTPVSLRRTASRNRGRSRARHHGAACPSASPRGRARGNRSEHLESAFFHARARRLSLDGRTSSGGTSTSSAAHTTPSRPSKAYRRLSPGPLARCRARPVTTIGTLICMSTP